MAKFKIKEAKDYYMYLLSEGKLKLLIPGLKGDWDLDKEEFLYHYAINPNLGNEDDEEDYELY